jgi:non-ribosomal peptide synthase protein (TIGR01720 family)
VTVPPQRWAASLAQLTDEAGADLAYWREQLPDDPPELPLDHPSRSGDPVLEADRRRVDVALDPDRTRILLREMPRTARIQAGDVLAAAVAAAVAEWTGRRTVHVDVEGQGRAGDLIDAADLYRSVGWFTSIAPLLVRLPAGDEPAAVLREVREQLRVFHHRAIGYGVLRYLDPRRGPELAARRSPRLIVNFVGGGVHHRDAPSEQVAGQLDLRPAPEHTPAMYHPDDHWPHLLDVSATVLDERLRVGVLYGVHHHDPATVTQLADRIRHHLEEFVDTCGTAGVGFTPADFPLIAADQQRVDALVAKALAAAPVGG